MKNNRVLTIATAFAMSLGLATAVFADKNLTILHTNDTHAHLIPFSDENHGTDKGGAVRRAGLIELIRREVKEPLLVDGGDISQGTTFFTLFKGEASFKVAKALGYDATTMGNHELDLDIEHLLELLDKTGLNLLGCNVAWPDGKKNVFKPYSIFVRNGLKIGVIGRIGKDNWEDCNIKITNKMKLLDDVETVRYYAKRIRPYVDVLIVISHSEVDNDRKLAASVAELDAVIAGHTHAVIQKPELIKHNADAGDYDNGLGGTLFTEAGEWGHYLGRIDLTVDEVNKKITKWDGQLIEVKPEHEAYASKKIKDLVEYYDQSRIRQVNRVIGHTAQEISYKKENRRTEQMQNGVFACEAMRYATKGDIGLINAKGVRTSVAAGDITVGNIHTMLPFDNTVIVVTLKGTEVQKMFDYMAASWGDPDATEISGATVELNLEEGKAYNIMIGGKPLDPNKEYRISTGSFVADGNCGGDHYFANPESMLDTGILMRDATIAYIEYLKEIPEVDIQTIKLVGKPKTKNLVK